MAPGSLQPQNARDRSLMDCLAHAKGIPGSASHCGAILKSPAGGAGRSFEESGCLGGENVRLPEQSLHRATQLRAQYLQDWKHELSETELAADSLLLVLVFALLLVCSCFCSYFCSCFCSCVGSCFCSCFCFCFCVLAS